MRAIRQRWHMRCIEYTGSIGNSGYGMDYDPDTQKTISAHRLAFKQANGYLPKVVMHSCDNPICINPAHLVAGTQSDNIKDCVSKGRYKSQQKLSLEDCEHIRSSSFSSRSLAKYYGVNQKTILNIKNDKFNYKDISGKGGSCGA